MTIPPESLHPDTLRALIEEFVTRDGAVQGHSETSLEQKVSSVLRQLKSGHVLIVFDEETEACSIAPRENAPREEPAPQPPDEQ